MSHVVPFHRLGQSHQQEDVPEGSVLWLCLNGNVHNVKSLHIVHRDDSFIVTMLVKTPARSTWDWLTATTNTPEEAVRICVAALESHKQQRSQDEMFVAGWRRQIQHWLYAREFEIDPLSLYRPGV